MGEKGRGLYGIWLAAYIGEALADEVLDASWRALDDGQRRGWEALEDHVLATGAANDEARS